MQSDYIRREDAVNACQEGWNNSVQDCINNIKALKPADVAPVRHGRWVSGVWCSECGWVNEVESGFIGDTKGFNFCPDCGAKMDAQGEE